MSIEDRVKAKLKELRAEQSDGQSHRCPRCGKHPAGVRTALSRHEDIYICDECGTDEAMRDFAKVQPLPLVYWNFALEMADLGGER